MFKFNFYFTYDKIRLCKKWPNGQFGSYEQKLVKRKEYILRNYKIDDFNTVISILSLIKQIQIKTMIENNFLKNKKQISLNNWKCRLYRVSFM